MFTINKYLQYKNTADSKPRVLVEGVDYKYISYNTEEFYHKFIANGNEFEVGNIKDKTERGYLINIDGGYDQEKRMVANLSDTRLLLSVEIENYRWSDVISDKVLNIRELQVVHYLGRKADNEEDYDREECWGIAIFNNSEMCVFFPHPQITWGIFPKNIKDKEGLLTYTGINASSLNYDDMIERIETFDFESDPKKYSKLLWNLSEEEGWKKVFGLLNIKV